MVDVLEMARAIRKDEDPATMMWMTLQILDWKMINEKLKRHALMVSMGMQEPDPLYQIAMIIGIAIGRIEDVDVETEKEEV